MKSLIKLIAVSGIATILVAGVFAQAAGPNGGGVKNGGVQGGKQGDRLAGNRKGLVKLEAEILAKVNPPLSAQQKSQIEQLNARTNEALAALKEKAKTGDRAALQPEMQRIQEQRQSGLRNILTPAQQQSYMELMKEAASKFRKDGAGLQGSKSAGARMGIGKVEMEILAKVNPPLSPDQKAQVEQLNARTNDALAALKEKAKTGDRAALRPEMQKIQQDRQNALKGILSPAQQESYKQLIKEAMLKIRKDGAGKGKDGATKGKGGIGKGG
jgi:Spy/CpxP family protein refolding chaperone